MTANEYTAPSEYALQLVILARLATAGHEKPPQKDESPTSGALANSLVEMGLMNSKPEAAAIITSLLDTMRSRRFIEEVPPAPRARTARWKLTESGARRLRDALEVVRLPAWPQIRDQRFVDLALAPAASNCMCGCAELIATTLATNAPPRASLRKALGRRWLYSTHPKGDLQGLTSHNRSEHSDEADASLLAEVKNALPTIGKDGRFGQEKVFVSAIWDKIAKRTPRDVSFDDFKLWLLDANRRRQLDLVRADLVGAMDAKLVADSEIRGAGAATFHFVVDHGNGARHQARTVQGKA